MNCMTPPVFRAQIPSSTDPDACRRVCAESFVLDPRSDVLCPLADHRPGLTSVPLGLIHQRPNRHSNCRRTHPPASRQPRFRILFSATSRPILAFFTVDSTSGIERLLFSHQSDSGKNNKFSLCCAEAKKFNPACSHRPHTLPFTRRTARCDLLAVQPHWRLLPC